MDSVERASMAARISLQQIFSVTSSSDREARRSFYPSTPQWVKANPMAKEVTQDRRERFGGLEVRGLQDHSQLNRYFEVHICNGMG